MNCLGHGYRVGVSPFDGSGEGFKFSALNICLSEMFQSFYFIANLEVRDVVVTLHAGPAPRPNNPDKPNPCSDEYG